MNQKRMHQSLLSGMVISLWCISPVKAYFDTLPPIVVVAPPPAVSPVTETPTPNPPGGGNPPPETGTPTPPPGGSTPPPSASTPEPGTLLLGLSAVGLAGLRFKRKKR